MIPFAGIYLEDTPPATIKCTCTRVFTEVLSIIAKYWKLPKCPRRKISWINYGTHSAAVERNEEELRELIWSEFWSYCSVKRSHCQKPYIVCCSVCKKKGKMRKHAYIYFFLQKETQERYSRKQSSCLYTIGGGNGWKKYGTEGHV